MKVEIVNALGVHEITGITDETGYLVLTTEKPEIPDGAPTVHFGGINPNAPLYIKCMTLCAVQGNACGDEERETAA